MAMAVIKKKIEIEVEFEHDFIPPEKFEGMRKHIGSESEQRCLSCPFYYYEQEECRENCIAMDIDVNADCRHDVCPIKKFFE